MAETTLAERFIYMRKQLLNLSQVDMAKALNKQQVNISHIESGRKLKLDPETIKILHEEFNVLPDWIQFGRGYPTEMDKVEAEEAKSNQYCKSENLVTIPFYHVKAAAGEGETLPDISEEDFLFFDKRWLNNVIGINSEHAAILMTEGDSMDSGLNKSSDIKNKDLLMIDTSCTEIVNGKTFVIQLKNRELVVKTVVKEFNGTVMLLSNNPHYAPRAITEEDEAKIIGKVVWNGSKDTI